MRQRVSLARTLAYEPDVILMDEPFAALDAFNRTALQEEILRINDKTRLTVLFITHDLSEALVLGRRVAVMSSRPGRIVDIYPIDLPEPRSAAKLRGTDAFLLLFQKLWNVLMSESDPTKRRAPMTQNPGHRRPRAAAVRLACLFWQFAAGDLIPGVRLVDPFFISSPGRIALDLKKGFADGILLKDVGITLFEAFAGLLIGMITGVAAGLAFGMWRPLEQIAEPFMAAFNALPRPAIAPLAVLWLRHRPRLEDPAGLVAGVLPGVLQHLSGREDHRPGYRQRHARDARNSSPSSSASWSFRRCSPGFSPLCG